MAVHTHTPQNNGDAPSGGAGSYLVHLPVGAIPDQLHQLEDAGGILGGQENKTLGPEKAVKYQSKSTASC